MSSFPELLLSVGAGGLAVTEGQAEGCSSWNEDTEHFQDADCKLLGRDSLSLWPAVFLLLYVFSEVPVAKMEGDFSPLSALKGVSELPEPGPAVNMAKDLFLCDGHS